MLYGKFHRYFMASFIDALWQVSSSSDIWFWRRDLKVSTIYGLAGHLVYVTWSIYTKFRSPFPKRLHMNFVMLDHAVSRIRPLHHANMSVKRRPPYTQPIYRKSGDCRCIHCFLILLENIDCGYSLEPPHWGGSNAYPNSMFWAKIRIISQFFIWKLIFLQPWNIAIYYIT